MCPPRFRWVDRSDLPNEQALGTSAADPDPIRCVAGRRSGRVSQAEGRRRRWRGIPVCRGAAIGRDALLHDLVAECKIDRQLGRGLNWFAVLDEGLELPFLDGTNRRIGENGIAADYLDIFYVAGLGNQNLEPDLCSACNG